MYKKHVSLTNVGTVVVCLSALILTIFSIISASTLTEQSNIMYKHPYQVKGQAQAMLARLYEIKLYLPTMIKFDVENPDEIRQLLAERDKLQDESLQVIRECYLGSQSDVDELSAALTEARQARLKAVDLFSSHVLAENIESYIDREVNIYSDEVEVVLKRISDYADNRVGMIRDTAEDMQRKSVIVTSLLCVFIIAMAVLTSENERRKNAEISYREQLFDLLSNNIDDVFYIYDCVNQRVEYVSNNSEKLLGINRRTIFKNVSVLKDNMSADSVAKLDELLGSVSLNEPAECEIQYQRNHTSLILKMRLHPIHKDNKLLRYIAVFYDQTKVIEHQNAMKDALLSAQMANNAKREFLSRMSHEIRTPMNTIIGMTTIAIRHIDNMAYVESCLKKVTYSSKHLLSLINDILDMSKIEDNKITISYEPLDFRKLIESITSIVYPQTVDRKQQFDVSISGVSEEILKGDMLRVNQIMLNLLSNAVKFTPDGGTVRFEVTKVSTKDNQIRLRFVVRDTGIGMDEEFLNRLYKPFEQANNTISQKYGGTGLGMSITKNLVLLMNGTITVDSRIGEGTAFTVELPFGLVEQENITYPQEFGTLKVLVVDDDQNTCTHAMVLLEQLGIHASWVCNGQEAVDKVIEAHEQNNDYDVCFIDWCMPEMDGMETARNIRKQVGPDTLIIIISAYDWGVIEKEAREAGVNAFVSKPIFISTIHDALRSIVFPKSLKAADEAIHEKRYSFKGKKVLLAEDNLINQEIAVTLLNEVDLLVDCAENGEEALKIFEQSGEDEYAIILMDVQMPKMDGYTASRAIHASKHAAAKKIPIIAMTANAFDEDVLAAKEAGMVGHIAKPIDVDTFYSKIAEFL